MISNIIDGAKIVIGLGIIILWIAIGKDDDFPFEEEL